MGGLLANIAFLNPWVLGGLVLLPALWFLLRVTPPAPRLIVFPAARFLQGLTPERATTAKTPWWLLLLRIMIIALIITALAQPVSNPVSVDGDDGKGNLFLIVDNSWPATQSWDMQMQETQRLLDIAARGNYEIYIFTTAPEAGKNSTAHYGPLTTTQAEATIKGLTPQPWPADYKALSQAMRPYLDSQDTARIARRTLWLGHGLREGDKAILQNLQVDEYVRPLVERLPLIMRPESMAGQNLAVTVSAAAASVAPLPVTVSVNGESGRILDIQNASLDSGHNPVRLEFSLPDHLYNQARQIKISGNKGAGGTILLDGNAKRHNIAIITTAIDGSTTPLIAEHYYLERALAPYGNVYAASLDDIFNMGSAARISAPTTATATTTAVPSVIIMPDIGALPAAELEALEQWVRGGGLLLRFAGPRMMDAQNFLVPVTLLKGNRALDGDMTWEKPLKLTSIKPDSPLYGLELPQGGLTVRRQILAAPQSGMTDKTWAALEDGTPLITADYLERGLIVMVHTAATPDWSDVPLSGFFVQMLRRIVNMAGSDPDALSTSAELLHPIVTMDGFGVLRQPAPLTLPIRADEFADMPISARHPPGIYGNGSIQSPLNLGERIGPLQVFDDIPAAIQTRHYDKMAETNLMPYLLLAAFMLFLADWIVMIVLQTRLRIFGRGALMARKAVVVFAMVTALLSGITAMSSAAFAQSDPAQRNEDASYASEIYLAYIRSGDSATDSAARHGLTNLAKTLRERTSVEPAGVIALDIEKDDLAFFPIIYWPVPADAPALSSRAQRNLQYYLDHGGTILIDTRQSDTLRRVMAGLNIPPLRIMPEDHVLTKAFYLLPYLHDAGGKSSLWVEEQSNTGRDGVSSVIIDSRDWAAIWSGNNGTAREQELAHRFGVNLVLYALTGNYKSDQVHLPHILERLGQ